MTSSKLLLPLALVLTMTALALAQNAGGTWTASFETQLGVQSYTFEFALEGTTLTGLAKSVIEGNENEVAIEEGMVEGNTITFVENLTYQGMPLRITYTGTIQGQELHLTRDVAGIATEELVATRPE